MLKVYITIFVFQFLYSFNFVLKKTCKYCRNYILSGE